MSILRHPRTLLASVGVALLLACGSDTITSPIFGAGCQAGTLRPGDTITVRFTTTSCFMEFDFWSYGHAPYVGYSVHLTQGHAYMIRFDSIPNPIGSDMDARLTLWTQNADGSSIPLAASDDDAGALNSALWFVAPATGTYQLVASGYWYGALGDYRLTMNECPVLGVLDTAGTYNFTLGASSCVRPKAANSTADTSAYSFLSFMAAPGEAVSAKVSSAAFPPVWEMFGPGFDTYANIYNDTYWGKTKGTGNTTAFTLGATGGLITLAVGATTVDSTSGAFSVQLVRTPAPAPPAGAGPWSVQRLPLMARKAPPAKTP